MEPKPQKCTSIAKIKEVADNKYPRNFHIRMICTEFVDPDLMDQFTWPKLEISNIEADSDSDESTPIEDKAENYYYKLCEEEYQHKYGINHISKNLVNHIMTRAPLYLAMVTAKISVTIGNSRSINMLLDCSSELNIITQELQEMLRIPMDPSGANWVLRGVSGHPVQLVRVCRNIAVDVSRLAFNHHFFMRHDPIGDKGMITGKPWYRGAR